MCCGSAYLAQYSKKATPIEWVDGVCRVCELNRNDTTEKKVFFCKDCNAFICKKCKPDLIGRGWAALISFKNKIFV
ncbi:hypothetical protein UFOVP916_44 [uncultured Caudovirales phage]|uniref:Uncharacterized protein n=1 Tax=uncultured Caudovirales phage TaxID=2100421 RepID=A0A6J5Q6Z4_9CAUD|nr:hypothetical protein UFOVP827_65 [uncultured Caudovirales phage]CAB4171473.1 hypothetical protein UFOVP916_44 [uncultured Caudovirales phage]CAB4177258.1 hypothetical protein UFOVP1001_2 [uncultured Caudovirales phage]CAB4198962.1 hypothetical protein UFOVP1338_8 [uncultured Caudovirales phage]CAB4213325.1 hypothetical protein UFOVP1447_3 [uncultured Caudovirales phage]